MTQESKPFKRIRAEDIQQLDSWSLPQMGGETTVALQQKEPGKVEVVEEEVAAEKITVAELESIRETARLEGLAAGLEEGRAEGLLKGKEQGLAQGKDQGYKEGFASGEAEVRRLQTLFQNMARELEAPLEQSAAQIEQLILGLTVQLAEKVVGAELKSDQSLLENSIRSSLNQIPETAGKIKIFINPSDHDYLSDTIAASESSIELQIDESIAQGGYRIDAQSTLIKSEVEERFDHVALQLLAALDSSERDDE